MRLALILLLLMIGPPAWGFVDSVLNRVTFALHEKPVHHVQDDTTEGIENCLRGKKDELANCLGDAEAFVDQCQSDCTSEHDDQADRNECRRECSEIEMQERTECFDDDSRFVCI